NNTGFVRASKGHRDHPMTIQQSGSALAILSTMFLWAPTANADDRAGKVMTVPVPAVGRPVKAMTDSVGTIHLLCASEAGPKYVRSIDGGVTVSAAIPVVSRGSQAAGLEYSAWDLAVGKGGRVHVAMGTNAWKLKLPQEEWGYFYANLDPGSSPFLPARELTR